MGSRKCLSGDYILLRLLLSGGEFYITMYTHVPACTWVYIPGGFRPDGRIYWPPAGMIENDVRVHVLASTKAKKKVVRRTMMKSSDHCGCDRYVLRYSNKETMQAIEKATLIYVHGVLLRAMDFSLLDVRFPRAGRRPSRPPSD
jgi:hypothetical protein